jgi:hypothetical protein
VLSGCYVEECAFTTDVNSEYAHKLDRVVSNGEEIGVLSQIREAEKSGNQSAKVAWLNKVENEVGGANVQVGPGLEAEDLS